MSCSIITDISSLTMSTLTPVYRCTEYLPVQFGNSHPISHSAQCPVVLLQISPVSQCPHVFLQDEPQRPSLHAGTAKHPFSSTHISDNVMCLGFVLWCLFLCLFVLFCYLFAFCCCLFCLLLLLIVLVCVFFKISIFKRIYIYWKILYTWSETNNNNNNNKTHVYIMYH